LEASEEEDVEIEEEGSETEGGDLDDGSL